MGVYFDILLNMSITGSVVILVVILMRFLLARAPKKYSYILWSIVGFRLFCPFSFNSIISIFNFNLIQNPSDIVTDSGRMNYLDAPVYFNTPNTGISTIGGADAPVNITVAPTLTKNFTFDDFIICIWLVGVCVLLAFGIAGYIKTRKQVRFATKMQDNIFQSENIDSPFILGIIKPKIYIPYNTDEEYLEYVIAHEKHHLKRGDNIIKLASYLLLCVYWFNPLCWVAFYLMNKDMEMSCDEYVLAHYENIKKKYSTALLSFSTDKKIISPSMLCFGEGSIKSRIKNVLKFKKPSVIVSTIAIILCIVISVVCVANPKDNNDELIQENENTANLISNEQIDDAGIIYYQNDNYNEPDNLDTLNEKYSFIFDGYWYSVIEDEEEISVCCTKFLENGDMQLTVYTYFDNVWTERYEDYHYGFDENDTIVYDWASGLYSKAFIQIDTKNKTIAEYDRNTMNGDISKQKVLVNYVQKSDNSLETAKSVLNNQQEIISKSEAIKIAYEKQIALYPDMNISFNGVELKNVSEQYFAFNTVYNPNESGHSYYGVSYFDNDTLCDFYYYCIDAVTGELIFNSMMGD